MVEDSPKSHRCQFCNSSFSIEILNKINEDKDDVYCEICGDIIKRANNKYNFNPLDIAENESKSKTTIKERPVKLRKEPKPNPNALHYPIGRIFDFCDYRKISTAITQV